MFCENCGNEISEDSKFCQNCGNEIEEDKPKLSRREEMAAKAQYCEVCRARINDEKFVTDNGIVMCKNCYSAFEFGDSDNYSNEADDSDNYSGETSDYRTDDLNSGAKSGYKSEEINSNAKSSWSSRLKGMCYIIWVAVIISGATGGNTIGSILGNQGAGILIGGIMGFIAGFVAIALIMTFIELCQNVSVMTKNSEEILKQLKDKDK